MAIFTDSVSSLLACYLGAACLSLFFHFLYLIGEGMGSRLPNICLALAGLFSVIGNTLSLHLVLTEQSIDPAVGIGLLFNLLLIAAIAVIEFRLVRKRFRVKAPVMHLESRAWKRLELAQYADEVLEVLRKLENIAPLPEKRNLNDPSFANLLTLMDYGEQVALDDRFWMSIRKDHLRAQLVEIINAAK